MKKGKLKFDQASKKKILVKEDGTEFTLPKGFIDANLEAGKLFEVEYDDKDGKIEVVFKGIRYPNKKGWQGGGGKYSKDKVEISKKQGTIFYKEADQIWMFRDKDGKVEKLDYPLQFKDRNKEYPAELTFETEENRDKLKSVEVKGVDVRYGTYRSEYARAPYNFVNVNDYEPLFFPLEDCQDIHKGFTGLSGSIQFEIENKTPLFIRGIGSDFPMVGGKPIIPGSSLRGLVRNMVEICAYSKLASDPEQEFFFRNISDESLYRNRFIKVVHQPGRKEIESFVKAGWLLKKEKDYVIKPCVQDGNGRQYYRFNALNSGSWGHEVIIGRTQQTIKPYANPLKVKFNATSSNIDSSKVKKGILLNYHVLKTIDSETTTTPGLQEGFLYATGYIQRKHYLWVLNPPDGVKELNATSAFKRYLKDENRSDSVADLEKKSKSGVPCFYLEKNDKVELLGPTGYFRIPYQNSIEKILQNQVKPNNIDFAERLFGFTSKTSALAGRVYFDDALLVQGNGIMNELVLKPLSSPKPTTYAHYLRQTPGTGKKTWNDSDIQLAGFKIYHHRNTPSEQNKPESFLYKFGKKEPQDKIYPDSVKPLKPGNKFQTTIRFENLTKEELGALLFVLALPDKEGKDYCYKLGMGKPLGLGSVKISNVFLNLTKHSERYKTLLSDDGHWFPAHNLIEDYKEYVQSFEKVILKHIKSSAQSLWEVKRLKELLAMLDFKNTQKPDWNNATRYMEIERGKSGTNHRKGINEYKERPLLPNPQQFSESQNPYPEDYD